VYSFLYNQCVFAATQKFTDEEAMIWGRAGWTGSQRFPIFWGGDPQSDWAGLASSIRGALSWGMSGGPFYAHDVGGYTAQRADPDLFVRWAQTAVLSSHIRFHGLGPREPWIYGEDIKRILKRWLTLRYRLIPYLQACALEAQSTGLPVMRAMPLVYPNDPICSRFEEQYLLGQSLFVAPVLHPDGEVNFYLPPGGWYDYWSRERIEGPQLIQTKVPLDRIPVYGRAGYLLPLGPAVQHTRDLKSELDLEQIIAFGTPTQSMILPGLQMDPSPGSSDRPLIGLPSDVELIEW
jgi:alpha-D-xyloside xylohydrolase